MLCEIINYVVWLQGHLPIVEYLRNASADVNEAGKDGATPLFAAAGKVSISSKDYIYVVEVCHVEQLKYHVFFI